MEYAVQAWSPQNREDIDILEKVQRRATKMVPTLRDLAYEDRLTILGLTSLEDRRTRGDMIDVFKILRGFEDNDRNKLFQLAPGNLPAWELEFTDSNS